MILLFGLKTDYKRETYDFWFIKNHFKLISLGTTFSERKELQNESMLCILFLIDTADEYIKQVVQL